MTLPGNRIPDEVVPEGSTKPSRDAELPPVFCRHSVSWSWVPHEGGYLCDDPQHFMGPAAVQVGTIDPEHQPTFLQPPNEAQRAALAAEDRQRAEDARQAYIEDLTRYS